MNTNLLSHSGDIKNRLKILGLSDEEITIYLDLVIHGPSSVVALSKRVDFGRNVIYRITDQLLDRKVIEQQLGARGMVFAPKQTSELYQLLVDKQTQIEGLKNTLPDLISQIDSLRKSSPETKVVYYEGLEGLKQVNYNTLNATEVVRVFELAHMSEYMSVEYAEKLRQEFADKKIYTRDLTNRPVWEEFTDVSEMVETYSSMRYVDPQLLNIEFEVVIYNDVYATYTFKENKIFCIEIHNESLAQMQKQLFDFVWNQAKPMAYVNNKGAAKIVSK